MVTALFSAVMFAATETTVYYTAPAETIGSYTVKLNVNRQGDANNWMQYTMTLTDKTYNSNPIYTYTFTDLYNGLGALQFQLYDGDTWKSQEQPISSWTAVAAYNGKMWIHGGSTWVELSGEEPDPTIAIKGAWDGWTLTQLVLAGNKETASLTKEMSVGNYEFGLELNSAWTANGSNFSRANNSYAVTGSGSNMHLDIDAAGEYTFTWTFATNTLEVTYPAEAEPIYTVVGVPALMGSEWSFAEAAGNDMEKQMDGTYKLSKKDVTLAAGSYEYKMVKNRSWSTTYPLSGNATLVIDESGKYDITFTLDLSASPEYSATPELKEAEVVIPTIGIKGAWDSWTTHTLEKASDDLTASATVNITEAGEYEFGVDKNSSFIANGETISRASNSSIIADANTGNMKLNADVAGDYTFTWTYASNTLEVTYPAEPIYYYVSGTEALTGHDWGVNADCKLNVSTHQIIFANVTAGEHQLKITDGDELWKGSEAFDSENSNVTNTGSNNIVFTTTSPSYITIAYNPETDKITVNAEAMPKVKFFAPREISHPWDNVYAHSWDGSGDITTWPGDAVTTKEGEWLVYYVKKGASLLFHDNDGMQTNDIENITADACYVSTAINSGTSRVSVTAQCTVDYYISGTEELTGYDWDAGNADLKLDENNQIVFQDLAAGSYEFKITNGTWAWSIGGNDFLKGGDCSGIATTQGLGNVGFTIDEVQDVTITYYPASREICLGATTVLPPATVVRDELTAGKWGTLCPRQDVENVEGAQFYQITSLQEKDGLPYNVIFDQISGTTLYAGQPYFFVATGTEIKGILTGIVHNTAGAGVNGFYGWIGTESKELSWKTDYVAGEDNTFVIHDNKVLRINQAGTMLKSGRCYININNTEPTRTTTAPMPGRRRITMGVQNTDAATGIEDVQGDNVQCTKVLINGQLFIIRGEHMFNATGRLVK